MSQQPADKRVSPSASGFFALRTPLLPLGVLEEWAVGLTSPQAQGPALAEALERDRALLRERLRHYLQEPLIREALFLASPSLDESLPAWYEAPDSERGQKVERTLVRYLARMAGRATPFGLFASNSLGRLAQSTRLQLAERAALRRHTRLDMDYVCALVANVCRAPEVRQALRYTPNTSLYRSGGRLRYLEGRQQEQRRRYQLVAVEPTAYLEATLERARPGATLAELAQALVDSDPEISLEEALGFTKELVESQLLVPTWAPTLTGPEPVPYLLEQAAHVPALAHVHQHLGAAHRALEQMDAAAPGLSPQSYREVARLLEPLPAPVGISHLFQVDAFRPAPQATLPQRVVEEMLRSVELLRRMTARSEEDPLSQFRQRFTERYEGRSVPLVEALDEEDGIGFVRSTGPGSTTGPLLESFRFPQSRRERGRWDSRVAHLLKRLEEVWRTGAQELVLTDEDAKALEMPEPVQLPESFAVMGSVLADSAEAVDRGDFRVVLETVTGPSGAVYLGRFCHGDPELEAAVREHLRAEEALRPEAIFAEIVHLPEERTGNIICRPVLRQHDIVFLGQSGAPEQIPVTDLWLSVEGRRLVLRSKRLGREVIPRLSHAHNFSTYGLGLYRFLCAFQQQETRGLAFRWSPLLGRAAFLPRVVYGRTVLHAARWSVPGATLEAWGRAEGVERHEAVQRFRQQARLPRWVCLGEGDNQLPVDLDNPLAVDTLVSLVKARPWALLEELLPGPGELCTAGPEGRYVHEVVVPFVCPPPASPPRAQPPAPALSSPAVRRSFPPGSEWLYLKLYAGTATVDRLLRTTLAEAIGAALATGAVERWFFLRYGDPEHHLRLRFRGQPQRLLSEVWPALQSALHSTLEEGSGWRLQLDTYEQEVERYGGPQGVELAEALFHADSEAVLALLRALPGERGADLRWRLALVGMDRLLEDLGLDLEAKASVLSRVRESFGAEFRVDKRFEEQLGARYRKESRALEALLGATPQSPGPAQRGLMVLLRRSKRLEPVAQALRLASQEGRLTCSLPQLATSFLHMHANRMLQAEQRPQELILYDFLSRLYRSRLARLAKQGRKQ